MNVTRKLATILYADAVDYSRLTGVDEVGTHKQLTVSLDKISKSIETAGGRVVHYAGDAVLAEFPSVVAAVETAIEIQKMLATIVTGVSVENRLQYRIGINLGEVIVDRDDVYGDGVNIAARLESMAPAGGICVSDDVFRQVNGKITASFHDMGELDLKNISGKVQTYSVNFDSVETAAEETTGHIGEGLELPKKPSIAVLPFDNMSTDPEQEYFADGMSEDIITALSRSPWLFIIARNTTFSYKGEKVDVKRVALELGVRYVLEGSVRKAGNRIRVTAQLIDGVTGGHIWSERYDGELAEIFDLQDEITRNVVASIQTQVHLTASEPAKKNRRPDLTVWELTMRGWQLLYDFSSESYITAKALLDEAIAHDPSSAEAHLVLAMVHYHDAIMGFVKDKETSLTMSRQLALRATRLDDHNEYAHWALGLSCMALARHEESIAALERAIELNPNCSVAYGSLGSAFNLVGRVDEAITNNEIAIRSNPRDPSIFFRFTGISLAHFLAGRYDAAIEWADKAVHRMPTWYLGHFLLAASHIQINQLVEARAAIERCLEVLPDASVSQLDRLPLKNATEMERFRDLLRKAGLPE